MENFQYYTPTKVVFGKGTEDQTGQLVAEQGCRKVSRAESPAVSCI